MPEHDGAWTPGPWTVACFMVKAGADVITQTGYSSTLGPPRAREAEANARLIASAPALYDALKAISDMLFLRPDMVAVLRPRMGPAEHAVSDAARAALALARGETNG